MKVSRSSSFKRLQQVQHLRLHGDIQRRDRLVGDNQARVQRQGAGDADALPLPAAENSCG